MGMRSLFSSNNFGTRIWGVFMALALLPVLVAALSAFSQDLQKQEKFMTTASSSLPPLDLQTPAVTETASFALG
jgi:hypothetical protein